MGYDRGDSFLFDFKPNVNLFGSKSKGKLSSQSYFIQRERKWKYSFLSVGLFSECNHGNGCVGECHRRGGTVPVQNTP